MGALLGGSGHGVRSENHYITMAAVTLAALLVGIAAAAGFGHGNAPHAATADRRPTSAALDAAHVSAPADTAVHPASASIPVAAAAPPARPAPVPHAKPSMSIHAPHPMAASQPMDMTPAPTVTTVRYGPIPVLPSLLGQPFDLPGGAPVIPPPCTNCFVVGTTIDMVFGDGRSANLDSGMMLHHLVLIQPGLPDTTCASVTPIGLLGQRFFASGNERTSGTLPAGFGYHLGTTPLVAVFDIMNMSSSLQLVYLSATVSWLPDSTPGVKPVTPVWLDENNCSLSVYSIPAGPTNRVWRWTSTIAGRVIAAGGHVHEGGVKTVLTNETTGRHICTSQAGYGMKPAHMGAVDSMSTCIHDRLGTVRAGDVLALDTYYDSTTAKSDVMGIMIAFVYRTDDLAGGTEDVAATGPPAKAGAQGPGHGMGAMPGMG